MARVLAGTRMLPLKAIDGIKLPAPKVVGDRSKLVPLAALQLADYNLLVSDTASSRRCFKPGETMMILDRCAGRQSTEFFYTEDGSSNHVENMQRA